MTSFFLPRIACVQHQLPQDKSEIFFKKRAALYRIPSKLAVLAFHAELRHLHGVTFSAQTFCSCEAHPHSSNKVRARKCRLTARCTSVVLLWDDKACFELHCTAVLQQTASVKCEYLFRTTFVHGDHYLWHFINTYNKRYGGSLGKTRRRAD